MAVPFFLFDYFTHNKTVFELTLTTILASQSKTLSQ